MLIIHLYKNRIKIAANSLDICTLKSIEKIQDEKGLTFQKTETPGDQCEKGWDTKGISKKNFIQFT